MGIFDSISNIAKSVATAIIPTKAKIENVGATLTAALTGKGVTASIPLIGTTANKVVSTALSNPYTTAGVAAVAVAPKLALTTATSAYNSFSTTAKVATVLAAPAVVSVAVSNPKVISSVASLPSSTSNLASNLAKSKSVSDIGSAIKQNPVLSATLGAAGLLVVGTGAAGVISSISNTAATKENTKAVKDSLTAASNLTIPTLPPNYTLPTDKGVIPTLPVGSISGVPLVPITPETQILGKAAGSSKNVANRKRNTRGSRNSQTMRINIFNQSKHLYSSYSY